MKILKIRVKGLPLFIEPLEINLYAHQRVTQEKNEMLTHVFSSIYTNNVLSILGINASGKTTTLKAISFILQLLKNTPISSISCNEILNELLPTQEVSFETYFCINNDTSVYKLETSIGRRSDTLEKKNTFLITQESLSKKAMSSIRSKKDTFNFDTIDPFLIRNSDDIYLLDDVSIMVGFNKQHKLQLSMIDSIEWTDFNGLRIIGNFPVELVKFLDPSIEYLTCTEIPEKDKFELKLKFINRDELFIHSPLELNNYLSSGTIKGINVFIAAIHTLQNGGYLLIDELENHFNKEIVATLIRFFTDVTTNKNGATIIFSTHYTELIDILERNDCIYIVRNMGGIKVDSLNTILTRSDVKKSEWFQSGYLEYTTPSYQGYIDFKRQLVKKVKSKEV